MFTATALILEVYTHIIAVKTGKMETVTNLTTVYTESTVEAGHQTE